MVTWTHYLWSAPRPVAAQAMGEVERRWGVALPEDYKRIISTHQGMSPEPSILEIGLKKTDVCVMLTISMDDACRAYSMTDTYETLKGHLPPGVYPFAMSSNGDYFCFDYRETPLRPRIVFWFTEASAEEALSPVAESFSEFLSKLRD